MRIRVLQKSISVAAISIIATLVFAYGYLRFSLPEAVRPNGFRPLIPPVSHGVIDERISSQVFKVRLWLPEAVKRTMAKQRTLLKLLDFCFSPISASDQFITGDCLKLSRLPAVNIGFE